MQFMTTSTPLNNFSKFFFVFESFFFKSNFLFLLSETKLKPLLLFKKEAILPPKKPLVPVINIFKLTPFIRNKFIVWRFSYNFLVAVRYRGTVSQDCIAVTDIGETIPD